MAKGVQKADDGSTTPGAVAAGSPSFEDIHGQHNFLLQAIMEVQKSLGAVGADVAHVKAAIETQSRKIDAVDADVKSVHKQVAFARGVFWVILALLGVAGFVIALVFHGQLQILLVQPKP